MGVEERVMTKAAVGRRRSPPPLQVVAFETRRRKTPPPPKEDVMTTAAPAGAPPPIFNLRRARFEVGRLCTKAEEDSASRLEARQRQAVALGARPPRAPAVNYRELKAQRKAEAAARLEAALLQTKGKVLKKTGRSSAPNKNKNNRKTPPAASKGATKAPRKLKSGILGAYGKVSKNKNNKKR